MTQTHREWLPDYSSGLSWRQTSKSSPYGCGYFLASSEACFSQRRLIVRILGGTKANTEGCEDDEYQAADHGRLLLLSDTLGSLTERICFLAGHGGTVMHDPLTVTSTSVSMTVPPRETVLPARCGRDSLAVGAYHLAHVRR